MPKRDPIARRRWDREYYQQNQVRCKARSKAYKLAHPRKKPEPVPEQDRDAAPQPRLVRDPKAVALSLVARAAELAKTADRDRARGYSGIPRPRGI